MYYDSWRSIVAALILCVAFNANAQVPKNAIPLLPVLKQQATQHFPEMKKPVYLAAQVEQESCASLKNPKCWNPKAELKTSREYGFGLGQLTVAYNKSGKVRFNKFHEMTSKYSALKDWKWNDRYDSNYQLTAIMLLDRESFVPIQKLTPNEMDRYAMMFSAYNGGLGGVMQDRRLCAATKGCNPQIWFGNVAKYSFKSKIKVKGYGQSAFDINRSYVVNVMQIRYKKYLPWFR